MYNTYFRAEGEPAFDTGIFQSDGSDFTLTTCTIKAFLKDGQGKFPSEDFKKKIINGNF